MLQPIPAPWNDIALVCNKCGRKLGGGFGKKGKKTLAKLLREALRTIGRRRDLRIVEVGCLGLCPKNAVTVAARNEVIAVPEGADPGALIDLLLQRRASNVTSIGRARPSS